MSQIPSFILLLQIVSPIVCFMKIAPMEDNFIISTEAKVRDVFNALLDALNLQQAIEHDLQRYLTIHNNLLAITLQSYEVIQEITQNHLLDKENVTENIFDEFIKNDTIHEATIFNTIKGFLVDLDYYRSRNGKDIVLDAFVQNEVVLNNSDEVHEYDGFEESAEESGNGSEFWEPKNLVESSRRIYQGENARINLFPFLVVVLVFKQFYCAGTIIESDLVVTAASCLQLAWNNPVFRDNPTFLTIRVGSSYYAAGGEIVSVKKIHFHPNFNAQTLKDNICLLRLSKHLNLNAANQKIKKVNFDREQSALLPTNDGLIIVGWGAKNHASTFLTLVEPLAFARLDVYSLGDCQDIYSKEFVSEHNFCAGFVAKGGGACNHDVGAPGLVNGVLTGIVTFGSPVCGTPDAPTVFTKIGFYAEWIINIMNGNLQVNPNKAIFKTEKMTTKESQYSKESKEGAKHENAKIDEKEHPDDDEVYLSFVRTLQAKDLMEVFNGKNKASSDESFANSADSSANVLDKDMEKKRKQVLTLLKDLVEAPKKDKHKYHNRHGKKSEKSQTTTTVAYDSSSGSKEFMDLLKGKLINSEGSKTKKPKHSKKKKSKPIKVKSSKMPTTSKSGKKKDVTSKKQQKSYNTTSFPDIGRDNTKHDILTAKIKKWIKELKNIKKVTTPIPIEYQSKSNDYYYDDDEDIDTAIQKQPDQKYITKEKWDTTTTVKVIKSKKIIKEPVPHKKPVSFDYFEQYHTEQKIKNALINNKTEKLNNINNKTEKLNKTDDYGTEIEDDALEYYADDTTPKATTVKPVGLLYADNIENILRYLPSNITETFMNNTELSSFVKSIYYNGDLKDTLFRADTLPSNDTQMSLSLTIQDNDDLRRNKALAKKPQSEPNIGLIADSFRHWLAKTSKINGSGSALYNKSDNEIYKLLQLAIGDL